MATLTTGAADVPLRLGSSYLAWTVLVPQQTLHSGQVPGHTCSVFAEGHVQTEVICSKCLGGKGRGPPSDRHPLGL